MRSAFPWGEIVGHICNVVTATAVLAIAIAVCYKVFHG